MIHLVRSTALLAVLALCAAIAHADGTEAVKALVGELAAAGKAKDSSAASAAIGKTSALYESCEDKALRGKLLGELGKLLKNKKLGDARMDALNALVELGTIANPKGAWKHVSKEMPNPKKVEEATELQTAVVGAAGRLAQKGAIKPLLELAAKAKDDKLAAAATRALGGYGQDKKSRVMILEELIDLGKRTRPGRSMSKAVSPVAQARWQAVGSALIGALNHLTGRKEGDFETWEELFKSNKKKPANLFEDDED